MEALLANSVATVPKNEEEGALTANAAESLIEKLKRLPIENVGSKEWMNQRETIEKLNLQAHINASQKSEEFVLAFLKSHDKMSTLIHELLVIEIWKEKVFPLLKDHLCRNVNSLSWYFVFYHEVTIANFLEVCFYDSTTFEDLDDDSLLELAMWCHRKLMLLNSLKSTSARSLEGVTVLSCNLFTFKEELKDVVEETAEKEMSTKSLQIEFSTASCAVTITRYITEALNSLPLCISRCLLCSVDVVMVLIPLIADSPWVRKSKKGKVERFQDNMWSVVSDGERLRICQYEAQVWLTLYNILAEPKCWSVYDPDEFRKAKILGIRRHFNEILFEQLPILKELDRVLDALGLGQRPAHMDNSTSSLILEQIPDICQNITSGRDWNRIARDQMQEAFGPKSKQESQESMQRVMEVFEAMCELEANDKTKTAPGGNAEKKTEKIWIEARRQATNSKVWERVLDFKMELNSSRSYEDITTTSKTGEVFYGRRYRLQDVEPPLMTPFPSEGKLIVSFRGKTSEIRIRLPALAVKSQPVAKTVWLTVGSLATDNFALQLKLRRIPEYELKTKNKENGYWDVYAAAGGAMTVSGPHLDTSLNF